MFSLMICIHLPLTLTNCKECKLRIIYLISSSFFQINVGEMIRTSQKRGKLTPENTASLLDVQMLLQQLEMMSFYTQTV